MRYLRARDDGPVPGARVMRRRAEVSMLAAGQGTFVEPGPGRVGVRRATLVWVLCAAVVALVRLA